MSYLTQKNSDMRIILVLIFINLTSLTINFPIYSALYQNISNFEREAVNQGLELYNLSPELNPENKVVNNIYIYTKSPFDKSGFLSNLDYLHITTKEDVIRRELFIKSGELYDLVKIRDSEFSLRSLSHVRSIAVIIPVQSQGADQPSPQGSGEKQAADQVDLLVVTRDLMSLQTSFSFEGSLDLLTNIQISLGEHNLLGNNKSISAGYEAKLGTHSWSARYFDPRLLGSRFQLVFKPSIIFFRPAMNFAGFGGELGLERPLRAESDQWGYGLSLAYGSKPIIDFVGGKIRTYDNPQTPFIEKIDRRYQWNYTQSQLDLRRSFGSSKKFEIFSSYNLNIKRPAVPEDLKLSEQERAAFIKDVLPKNELESYISLGAAYFHNTFLYLYDYDNFKLAEILRTGPSIVLANDFSSKYFLFSDHNFLRPQARLSYMLPIYNDSFIKLSGSSSNRYDANFSDNTYKLGLSLVSSKIAGLARLVLDARLSMMLDNRDNQNFSLGSDSGLRGLESRFYSGNRAFRSNLELRSAPVELWLIYAGLILFYDSGFAAKNWNEANATHSLGFGFRFLAPQVSSQVFRIDLGFPIYGRGARDHIVVPSFGLGQAF